MDKLPTYLRMGRGVLTEAEGQPSTGIHINKLGSRQGKDLVERFVKIGEEDNDNFFLKLREHITRNSCMKQDITNKL
ncbi:hypothetical protein TanjilG_10962 [Lupinus angustifolius]|uniref:Uncharacterized protein n=1 Tax=Lupinus angustifolius TaxID=3871 RepID=A0A1J7HG30_LUPAN|nr:hypothetical protein TanjilG_10962 [Lupinus angustifolius]